MFGFSLPEIIFLAVLALVVIGPKQLPEVARTLGRFLNELRRASSSLTDEFRQQVKIDPIRLDDIKPATPSQKPAAAAPEPAHETPAAPVENSETKKS